MGNNGLICTPGTGTTTVGMVSKLDIKTVRDLNKLDAGQMNNLVDVSISQRLLEINCARAINASTGAYVNLTTDHRQHVNRYKSLWPNNNVTWL